MNFYTGESVTLLVVVVLTDGLYIDSWHILRYFYLVQRYIQRLYDAIFLKTYILKTNDR